MKIALDSWVLASRFRHQGTYVYARSLIAEFKKIAAKRPEMEFCLFTSPRNSNDAVLLGAGGGFALMPAPQLAHDRLWRLRGARRAAASVRADLIFAPTVSVLPVGKIPVVCTIHDATPVLMPSHSQRVTLMQRSMLWFAARFARKIITPSECSRRDLINLYGLPDSKITVVYEGHDKAIFNDAAPDPGAQKTLLSKLKLDKPYILHHGVIQPRKNLKRLIEAYRLLLSRNPDLPFDLVLAGPLGWNYENILATAQNGDAGKGRVLFPGTLEDHELAMLIKGANLIVMPSLYEGFCLPMVESMACGVPVIAASTSCLPEISGGALKYFDPHSLEDMAACMEQVLEDNALRQRLAQQGKKRAANFDWATCAEKTVAIFEECARM
ncbi:MAG TPA: glycosyltransferase family 1 protein [Candidatus Angelobacter sp.]